MKDRDRAFWLIVYRSLVNIVKALAKLLEIEHKN